MEENKNILKPKITEDLILKSSQIGFDASCDNLTGNFLRMLVASRQQIDILELGTGVGYSTSWLLDGIINKFL